ncbi:hypothetical protein [Enterococcus ureasiticus]|uniref:Uncharacterized protein n=1 Tax=Enterococcus ureasiticus TaxID=903984 RepID=A0A1E5GBP9_9ENTE|nr:hypothetical protein [Enterococcus ureasiticus]OEG09680.1 hypothetical protein BCR21_15180 [Enterococcus ureasiticus]
MALTREFEMFKSSKNVVFNKETRKNMVSVDDTFILYGIDTLKWIPSFSKNFEQSSNGLDYYERTYLDSEGITVLKGIIGGGQIFKYCPVKIELTSDCDTENGKFNSVIIEKETLVTQLQDLFVLCDSAIKKDYILVHFGI